MSLSRLPPNILRQMLLLNMEFSESPRPMASEPRGLPVPVPTTRASLVHITVLRFSVSAGDQNSCPLLE